MVLNIMERLMLFNMLMGMEGDFLTLKAIRQLREVLEITEEEQKASEFERVDGGFKWERNIDKEFEFTERETSVIVGRLKFLDEAKRLTEQHYSLYEKFIPDSD